MGDQMAQFQQLLEITYSDVTTRDRLNHSGSWMVPREYVMVEARRNENSKLWRKYCIRKAELQQEKKLSLDMGAEALKAQGLPEYRVIRNVETTKGWEGIAPFGAGEIDTEINEWYLFHGTSA